MARRLKDAISRQAKRDARLKYAPQRRALTANQQAIADQFAAAAAATQASARGIGAAADEARPKIQGYAQEAQGISDQASRDLSTYLGSSPLQGAAARDAAGTRRRLSEMVAGSNTELDRRKVDATAGAAYTINTLRQAAGKELEKVGGQLTDLASDEGTYASTQANALRQAAAGRQVTRRGQDLSHQDRVAGQRETRRAHREAEADRDASRGAGRLPGGAKPASPEVQNKAQDTIASALSYARKLKAGTYKDPRNAQRGPVGSTLLNGQKDDTTGAQLVPKFNDHPIYLTAALDVAYNGELSQATIRKLHSRGISVDKLGFPTKRPQSAMSRGRNRTARGV